MSRVAGVNRTACTSEKGYRYDGLYHVSDYWSDLGRSGFKVWRFRLEKEPQKERDLSDPTKQRPERVETTVQRLIRDTKKSREVKEAYDYTCQFCGTRLLTPAGPYAEGAHIQPLGEPHNGPDSSANMLCLCPNHHVLFDMGAITISDDLSLIGRPGSIRVITTHRIGVEYLRYHREHYGTQAAAAKAAKVGGSKRL